MLDRPKRFSRLAVLCLSLTALITGYSRAALSAWYPLNEAHADAESAAESVSGGAASLVGYNADIALSFLKRGEAAFRPGMGTAYRFTRTAVPAAGGGLNLGNGAAVQPTDRFTIAFWFRLNATNTFARFFESQSTNVNTQHGIRIDTGSTGNKVRVLVRSGTASNTQLTHSRVLGTGASGPWYFAAFRYDTANAAQPFAVTVLPASGTPVSAADITAATEVQTVMNTGVLNSPHAIATLAGMELPAGTNVNNLDGVMDDIAFYTDSDGNGVLSDAALADVHNFGPLGQLFINSFTAGTAAVAPGAPVQLNWRVVPDVTALTVSDGVNPPVDVLPFTTAGTGGTTVNPTATTTYTLSATKSGGTQISTLVVTVGEAPAVTAFAASPRLVAAGGTSTLSWNVNGATTLTLNPGGLNVTGLTETMVTVPATTSYTLTAANGFGNTAATIVVEATTGPIPSARYRASDVANSGTLWRDNLGAANWTLVNGLARNATLPAPSPHTNFTASYTGGGNAGGYVNSFVSADFSVEAWVRPGTLTADYECIFENGGGQNGCSILVNNTEFRFLGSALNVRTVDFAIPLDGLNLSDFVQVVFGFDGTTNECFASVRDTFGNVRAATANGDVVNGTNGAGLFQYASGALVGASQSNLGGFTEVAGAQPNPVTGFAGEIAALNIYTRSLTTEEVGAAFALHATTVAPPEPLRVLNFSLNADNTATVQWNSVAGHTYVGQFSTDFAEWFNLEDPFNADKADMARTFTLPPPQPKLFIRMKRTQP